MKAKIGILTVSDRASAGVYEDLSGKAIISVLVSTLKVNGKVFMWSFLTSNLSLKKH